MEHEVSDVEALRTRCSYCFAMPGEPCLTHVATEIEQQPRKPHAERRARAFRLRRFSVVA